MSCTLAPVRSEGSTVTPESEGADRMVVVKDAGAVAARREKPATGGGGGWERPNSGPEAH